MLQLMIKKRLYYTVVFLLLCAVYECLYVVIDVLIFEKSVVVNFQLLPA